MSDLNEIVNKLSSMKVTEIVELVKTLEEKWGVSAAPVASVAAPVVTNTDGSANVVEKNHFDIIVTSAGASKIGVIKVVREITGLGLQEAKALVDAVPKTIKEKVSKSDAEELKKKLEEAGASVELK